jgi:hypothetical protein
MTPTRHIDKSDQELRRTVAIAHPLRIQLGTHSTEDSCSEVQVAKIMHGATAVSLAVR